MLDVMDNSRRLNPAIPFTDLANVAVSAKNHIAFMTPLWLIVKAMLPHPRPLRTLGPSAP